MKKVIVCAPRRRRASRAAKMRTLLRHARPMEATQSSG
jgi:hypothetical protein